MASGPSARDEELRLAALRKLAILDTPNEDRFERITRLACLALNVPIAAISFVDRERVWFKSVRGMSITEIPRDSALCSHALRTDGPTVIADLAGDERFRDSPLVKDGPKLRFYASSPLYSPDGRRVGGMCVLDREPRKLAPEMTETLRDLAHLVESEFELGALAEAQSALANDLEAVRRQVYIDSLTQIWNRAGILEILHREHARAKRNKVCIGVAVVDLDNFKAVNDTHGHLIGDRVLRTAAERMAEAVRPYDAVGRYGGEEFLIVIVERGPDAIVAVAERIRDNIAKKPVSTERKMIPISASVGIACSDPQHAGEVSLLIQAADEALYTAKRAGRNQVVVAK